MDALRDSDIDVLREALSMEIYRNTLHGIPIEGAEDYVVAIRRVAEHLSRMSRH